MISIYSSAFNLIKNKFDYKFTIEKFCTLAEEVVIAVNTSEDNTLDALQSLSVKHNNLKIITSNIPYDDPLLDGKIKNIALQKTTQKIKLGLDMDEYVPEWQKHMWYVLAHMLLRDNACLCYMIPSVNLYMSHEYYFSITPKWYLHKENLFRGPVNFARKSNGYIDINKSDTCELIDENGNLVTTRTTPIDIDSLRTRHNPFVVHTGYLSLEDRLTRNQQFWRNHWLVESGGEQPNHKVHDSLQDFDEKYFRHELLI